MIDTVDEAYARAKQNLGVAQRDFDAIDHALKNVPDREPEELERAKAAHARTATRLEAAKAAFASLDAVRTAERKAARETERKAQLAEAGKLETRAKELREKAAL